MARRSDPGREARAKMEQAAGTGETGAGFEEKLRQETGDAKFAHAYRNRGRLYDKIKIPLHTMDILIYALAALIVIAVVVGILIGN